MGRARAGEGGTHVALLAGALDAEAGAFGLAVARVRGGAGGAGVYVHVADAAAGVALLGGDGAGLGAGGAFVAGLAAVVAEPLVRRACLRRVSAGACPA